MKRINHLFRYLLAGVMGMALLASCSQDALDAVNRNGDDPKDVPAQFILMDLITATAINTVGSDLSMYASIYMELEAGVHHQAYNAETRNSEPVSATTYNESWVRIYTNISNAKEIIRKCSAEGKEAGNDVTMGMAQVLYAINLGVLTDLFGDVPFKQTGIFGLDGLPVYKQPAVDTQQEAYNEIFALLDAAILNFDKSDSGPTGSPGKKDLLYNSAAAAWKKAAYGLKARYKLNLLGRVAAGERTAYYTEILGYISNSFNSVAEQMSADIFDGDVNNNPLRAIWESREFLGASQSLVDKFAEREDFRYRAFINWGLEQCEAPEEIYCAENGNPEVDAMEWFDFSAACEAPTAPIHLMSYHELLFIKAEVQARSGNTAGAEATLKEAVLAAYANLNVTLESASETCLFDIPEYPLAIVEFLNPEDAEDYFDDSISGLYNANPLQEVMIEKYLACFGANGESLLAYNDYRRMQGLGENFIVLANPKNTNRFPLRFAYGADDVNNNPHIKTLYGNGQYVYSENVWWAGGTR